MRMSESTTIIEPDIDKSDQSKIILPIVSEYLDKLISDNSIDIDTCLALANFYDSPPSNEHRDNRESQDI